MNAELAQMRDDLAPAWLPPLSLEETAERYIRPALRERFVRLCRGSAREYLGALRLRARTCQGHVRGDGRLSGLDAGYDTPGTA